MNVMYHPCHDVLCSSKIQWHHHSPVFLHVYLNFSDAYLFCSWCSLSYCSVALTRHHDQGDLRKETNWELAHSSTGLVRDHHDTWSSELSSCLFCWFPLLGQFLSPGHSRNMFLVLATGSKATRGTASTLWRSLLFHMKRSSKRSYVRS